MSNDAEGGAEDAEAGSQDAEGGTEDAEGGTEDAEPARRTQRGARMTKAVRPTAESTPQTTQTTADGALRQRRSGKRSRGRTHEAFRAGRTARGTFVRSNVAEDQYWSRLRYRPVPYCRANAWPTIRSMRCGRTQAPTMTIPAFCTHGPHRSPPRRVAETIRP